MSAKRNTKRKASTHTARGKGQAPRQTRAENRDRPSSRPLREQAGPRDWQPDAVDDELVDWSVFDEADSSADGASAASARQRSKVSMWVEGARLRTLPLAISPVLLGSAAGQSIALPGTFHWDRAIACLIVALCLQIGVNYANDYSDGVRGTDDSRVGPPRLTASGTAKPKTVRNVAFTFFGIAAIAGIYLCWVTGQWWMLAVGLAAILAAWFYTGGKRPYGYFGLGEVFVFIFFGLVATLGTCYVQVLELSPNAWLLAVAVGLFACAVLMVNNIRDRDQDRIAGKRTMAVLIGMPAAKLLYTLFVIAPYAIGAAFALLYRLSMFSFFTLLLTIPALIITWFAEKPSDYIIALRLTSIGSLLWAVMMSAAIVAV